MARQTKILALMIVLLVIGWAFYPSGGEIIQPIAYNHKLHVEGEGLECSDCHSYVESMPAASIPKIEVCQDCHSVDEPLGDSPEESKLLKYLEEEREIPWNRIYEVPEHVYFSHRRHVVLGRLECSQCHGNVAELTKPAAYPIKQVTMNNCMDCHKQHKVSNDCLACHR